MKNNTSHELLLKDGSILHDTTDWEAVAALTEAQVIQAALSDPDAQPSTEEQHRNARRVWDMPGDTLYEKLQASAEENKRQLTVRYDPDVIAFFRAQGKGYQTLMNKVLRTYMENQIAQNHA